MAGALTEFRTAYLPHTSQNFHRFIKHRWLTILFTNILQYTGHYEIHSLAASTLISKCLHNRGADKSFARPYWKKKLKGRHFSSDAEVIAAAETWLDGQNSEFFWVACKSYSLVAVACFIPGWAKDLSAPGRILTRLQWRWIVSMYSDACLTVSGFLSFRGLAGESLKFLLKVHMRCLDVPWQESLKK